jgi:hypothetical protein
MHITHLLRLARVAIVLTASLEWSSGTALMGQSSKFNQPGNILITDQFNNRAIEIDPAGDIVWAFGGLGPGNTTPNSIFVLLLDLAFKQTGSCRFF